MTRPKKQETPPAAPEADPFIAKIQEVFEKSLVAFTEPKDINALLANAVKFLAVKHKIEGADDGGSVTDY